MLIKIKYFKNKYKKGNYLLFEKEIIIESLGLEVKGSSYGDLRFIISYHLSDSNKNV